jgi:hypothetical protein
MLILNFYLLITYFIKNKKQSKNNELTGRIYKLKNFVVTKICVGQIDSEFKTRFREHGSYIRNKYQLSTYALHTNNYHEYGPMNETTDFIKTFQKGCHRQCLENFHIQVHQT